MPQVRYDRYLDKENALHYGFGDPERHAYKQSRTLSADDYIAYIGTHADHITLAEPYRSRFFDGIRGAIISEGGSITLNDTIVLYMVRKP